jgi:hypothetical protein
MENATDRRDSKRFTMTLPLNIRCNGPHGTESQQGETRDISFRGLYFMSSGMFQPGTQIEFVLTLPKEITQTGNVNIRCFGQVIRVEPFADIRGIAARIERYEFIQSPHA